jgi:hypothetical protein
MKASSLCGVETLAAFFVTTLQWQSISVSRFLPLLVPILTLSLSLSLSPPFSSLAALLNLEELRRTRVVAQSA